ncbi:MAG: fatty acid metabolism transcriptional regulator FadR [Anaerolineales bacterium]|nr:fatty acid metabolism transcriptional regulator FadR [Anaerolineales bacterium]
MDWETPPKRAEWTENRLIESILEGHFPINATLPSERELATQLGITRPTLREALQRLARDGWLEIHQGRPTRVRDFWREGNLGVLGAIARSQSHLPPDFVPDLLEVRLHLAPIYTRAAIRHQSEHITNLLTDYLNLDDEPQTFAQVDWELHYHLTIASGNPVYTLILNGFDDLYKNMAPIYFSLERTREHSRAFYRQLHRAAQAADTEAAERITRQVMHDTLDLWRLAAEQR